MKKMILTITLMALLFMIAARPQTYYNEDDGFFYVELESPPTDNIIGEAGKSMVWNINKTGLEENLDIIYNVLNETATEFCVGFENMTAYTSKVAVNLLKRVPLEKTKLTDKFNIETDNIDLSKTTEVENEVCFTVSYPEIIEGIQFKIGFGSVTIDSLAVATATSPSNARNLCIGPNGVFHATWESSGDDLWYGNSTDDGVTWTTKEISDTGSADVGIVCQPNGNLFIYYTTGGDVIGVNSTDNGATWSSAFTIADNGTNILEVPSCQSDSQSNIHCCFIQGTGDLLDYVNSSIWDGEVPVNLNTADDTDYCDIVVGENDCVYVFGTGSDQDDLDVWATTGCGGNGWGDANRIQVFDGASVLSGSAPSVTIEGTSIYATWTDSADLQFCNGTTSSLTTWSCQEIDSLSSYHPSISANNAGIHIFYMDSTTFDSTFDDVMYANSSDGSFGGTWSVRTQLQTDAAFGTIADTAFPTQNRMTDTLRYVYTDNVASPDVIYDNFTVPFTDATYPTITLNSPADSASLTSTPIIFNCSATDNEGLSSIALYGNWTNSTTTVTLDDTSTEVLADVSSEDDAPGSENTEAQIKFDISSLAGATVTNATLCLYLVDHLGGSSIDTDVNYWRVDNQTWDETITAAGYDAQTEDTAITGQTFDQVVEGDWSCLNVTGVIVTDINDGNSYTTIRMEDPDNPHDGGTTAVQDEVNGIMFGGKLTDVAKFEDRENTLSSGNTPKLIVTYQFAGWNLNETNTVTGLSNTTTFSINLSGGDYKWACKSCDTSSNCNQSSNRTFSLSTADTTPPSINFTSPTDINTTITTRNWTFVNTSASETLDNCTLNWNNYATNYTMNELTTTSFYYNVTNIANGNYTYRVSCNDTSGNLGNSSTIWVNVSYALPSDTCTVSGTAPHGFDLADDCDITTQQDAGGYSIYTYGTCGSLTVRSTILNVRNLTYAKDCTYFISGTNVTYIR